MSLPQFKHVASPTIEFFNSGRFEIDIHTFDVALHLADKELGDGAFGLCPLWPTVSTNHASRAYTHLHLRFELVLQDSVELLYVML